MKKFICLLLVAVLALSLVACGPAKPKDDGREMEIVGTWTLGKFTQVFKDDHTGTLMNASGIEFACDWEYKQGGKYAITYSMGTVEAVITVNEDGSLTMLYNEGNYKKAN